MLRYITTGSGGPALTTTHLTPCSVSSRGPQSQTYWHCLHNRRTRTGNRTRSFCQRTTYSHSLCTAFQVHSQVSTGLQSHRLEHAKRKKNNSSDGPQRERERERDEFLLELNEHLYEAYGCYCVLWEKMLLMDTFTSEGLMESNQRDQTRGIRPEESDQRNQTRGIRQEGSSQRDQARGIKPEGSSQRDQARGIRPEGSDQRDQARGIRPEGSDRRDQATGLLGGWWVRRKKEVWVQVSIGELES